MLRAAEPYQVLHDPGDGAEAPEVIWSTRGFGAAWRDAQLLAAQRAPEGVAWHRCAPALLRSNACCEATGRGTAYGAAALRARVAPAFALFEAPAGGLAPGGRAAAALARREWFGVFRGGVLDWYARPLSPGPD